jgi:predicted nucleic acid-binding Zn ribbon protein
MEKITQPLRELLDKLRLSDPMTGWQAVDLWPETVGERIAAHARASAFRDGTLIVEVDSTAWMNELTYLERRIKTQLNRRIGDDVVRAIRLRPAAGTAPQPRKRNRP